MRLDLLLVHKGLCETRQEAQEAIAKAKVLVEGAVTTKQSKDVKEGAAIEVLWSREYVSRGGDKLSGIFYKLFMTKDSIRAFLHGKNALDIGSSTGGFTDFLLQNGIGKVVCVDVGTNQLHASIRDNPHVTVYENTDIRNFSSDGSYDVIVADLSFIPLKNVVKTITAFGRIGSYFFLLIKPQFEVGRGNTKKGVVKDMFLVKSILAEYETMVSELFAKDISIEPCAIQGGDGNQEYFLSFKL